MFRVVLSDDDAGKNETCQIPATTRHCQCRGLGSCRVCRAFLVARCRSRGSRFRDVHAHLHGGDICASGVRFYRRSGADFGAPPFIRFLRSSVGSRSRGTKFCSALRGTPALGKFCGNGWILSGGFAVVDWSGGCEDKSPANHRGRSDQFGISWLWRRDDCQSERPRIHWRRARPYS